MREYKRSEVLLKATGVNLQYDGKQILENINFTIQNVQRPEVSQGQVVSLIGRSGIGKTQLFKIIAGIITPDSGTVTVGVDQHPVQAGEIGIVPQNYILFNHRTIYNNLRIGLNNCGTKYSASECKNLIDEYASKFDLKEHLNKFPAQLSGGQRQRVSIIQQALTGNNFILLDEPFSGLDPLMIDRVSQLLSAISIMHEHKTLIIVSHDLENTLALSDTAYILARKDAGKGATITEEIDLIALDFAWRPDIKTNAAFQRLVDDIKNKI